MFQTILQNLSRKHKLKKATYTVVVSIPYQTEKELVPCGGDFTKALIIFQDKVRDFSHTSGRIEFVSKRKSFKTELLVEF